MRYRGKGRPKSERPKVDLGSKELQEKRLRCQTEELLDSYHRRGLISEKQYWCGNHFRWLYTARFGIPNLKAASAVFFDEATSRQTNEQFQQKIELEYKRAAQALQQHKLLDTLLNIVIYSQCVDNHNNYANNALVTPALDVLVELWC